MQSTLLAHWIYLTGLGAIILARHAPFLSQARPTLAPGLGILPSVLALVALADYAASLLIECAMHAGSPDRQRVAPVVTAAFGVSIAIYGMIVWLLGASTGWFWFFVATAGIHWFHAALRWQNLQPGA